MIKSHRLFIENTIKKPLDKCKKLNLGSGKDYREGWTNLDFSDDVGKIDVKHNLYKFPLPFKDNSFDYIFSAHTLEHLKGSLSPLMIELWRILKPHGILEVRVPHFSHYSALTGFEHKNVFSINGFNIFTDMAYLPHIPGFPPFKKPLFTKVRGKLAHQRKDDGNRMLISKKNAYYYVSNFIDHLANKNTNFCEKIWCYWVGGFQEMQIVLRKIPQDIKLDKDYFNKIVS